MGATRHPLDQWPTTAADARALQQQIAQQVVRGGAHGPVRTIVGADCAFTSPREAVAGILVYTFPALEEIERVTVRAPVTFPYIPGLLAFREGPALMQAFERLKTTPDLVIFDGQGIAHPRRCGIASHLGVLLDVPSIGCAKSLLCGTYREPRARAGHWSPLCDANETIGAVVRTRDHVRPVYISPGHRVTLSTAIAIILQCCDGYRIPKPTRDADRYVAQLKRQGR